MNLIAAMYEYEDADGNWPDETMVPLFQAMIDNGMIAGRFGNSHWGDTANRLIREGKCRQSVVAGTGVKLYCPRCGNEETVTNRSGNRATFTCGHTEDV